MVLSAQSHFPLVEHFTNSRCPLCADGNVYYYRKLDKYREKVNHISFYVPIPYNQCEFYQASKSGSDARMVFYNIIGTPCALLDGKITNGTLPTDMNYMVAIDKTPHYSLELKKTSSTEVKLRITPLIDISETIQLNVYVAIIEKEIDKLTPNQETKHYDVFRGFISANDGNGISIPAGTKKGEHFEMNWNVNFNFTNSLDKYKYVAFIQNNITKDVLESQSSEIDSKAGNNSITEPQKLVIAPNPTSGNFKIVNNTTSTIESVDVYNSMGNKIFSASQSKNLEYNLNLTSGIYFVHSKLHSQIKPIINKLIIQ